MFGSDRPALPRSYSNTLYAKLGISPDSSAQDIEAAYKVLEQTYRPGGAYVDDVMHLAFTEIFNAAAILRNPKRRKAYDQGYIDDQGRQTEAGASRAARIRTIGFGGGILLAGLAGFMIVSSWMGASTPAALGGADRLENKTASASDPRGAPEPHAIAPTSAPRRQEQASKPDVKPPGMSSPVHADDRDYLPPQAVNEPEAPGEHKPPEHVRPAAKRYASLPRKSTAAQPKQELNSPRPEQRRLAGASKPAQQDVQSYIWFGWPPLPHHEPMRISESLRSAHCLACLTNHNADCSAACR